ncbi:unnamed protein product, partial [Dibothriocephalus latus]
MGKNSGPSPMVTLFLNVLLSLDPAQKKRILSLVAVSDSFPQWSDVVLLDAATTSAASTCAALMRLPAVAEIMAVAACSTFELFVSCQTQE